MYYVDYSEEKIEQAKNVKLKILLMSLYCFYNPVIGFKFLEILRKKSGLK